MAFAAPSGWASRSNNNTNMKYRKKPVVIEAIQVLGTNDAEVKAFCPVAIDPPARDCRLVIKTLEGEMTAMPGDWIIKGVKGEFYPCKPDIFAATYDAVTE